MYFTNGSSRAFEMLMRGKPGFDRYTFTVRIGSTSSVCMRNVRMSRAS